VRTQAFGSTEVHKITEIERMAVDPAWLLGNITPEIVAANRDWLGPVFVEPDTDKLVLSFHSFVIRTPAATILVDTCNGNDKHRPTMPAWDRLDTPYLQRLKALGFEPDDIDIVLCTHLHADHVGWNTRLENGRWVPTFPNARYVMSRHEYAYFEAKHRENPPAPINRGSFADSVLPIVEAGRATLVDPGDGLGAELGDQVWLEDAAGHSPGGMNLWLTGGGRRACFCGDVIHHAIQCADPELNSPADFDRAMGVRARRALLAQCADTDTVLMTGHFPDPTAGQVIRHGNEFRFQLNQ
jgi:glyoxylase-like metal-dependent hydrolase (beta-lactamase superfamily II)